MRSDPEPQDYEDEWDEEPPRDPSYDDYDFHTTKGKINVHD